MSAMNELSRLGHEVSAGQIPDLDNNQSPFRGPLAGWASLQSDQRSEPAPWWSTRLLPLSCCVGQGEVKGPWPNPSLDPSRSKVTVSSALNLEIFGHCPALQQNEILGA